MSETPEPEVPENDDEQKRKRRLLLFAFIGAPVVLASSIGFVAVTQGATDTAPATSVEAEINSEREPQIRPGALEDPAELGTADPSNKSLIDLITSEQPPSEDVALPVAPTWPSAIVDEKPTATPDGGGTDPVAPTVPGDPSAPSTNPDPTDPTPDPKPTPHPTPDPTPQPTPDPLPSPDPTPDPTPTPKPEPSTDPTPAPTPDPTPGTGGPTPEPSPDPTPGEPEPTPEPTPGVPEVTPTPTPEDGEKPTTGGENSEKSQLLAVAVRLEAYKALMHVTGEFDMEGATWRLTQGEFPTGIDIDPVTGTIAGTPTSATGSYLFQLEVDNGKSVLRGWFTLMVFKEIAPETPGEPGDPDEPGTNPGTGGEDGGTVIPNPNPGDDGDEGGTPGEGTDPVEPGDPETPTEPVDPTNPTDPGEGTDPVDPVEPGEGTDPTDPGTGEPGEGTEPVEPVDPTDPTDPQPGDGTEVEPEDPTINPGEGGIKIDKLEFTVPTSLDFQVGTEIDVDLAATSSTGLAISYTANGLPSWLTFVDGHLRGTVPTISGSFTIQLTASNEKNTSTKSSAIYVNPNLLEMSTETLELDADETQSIELLASNGASNANMIYTLVNADGGTVTLDGATLTARYPVAGSYRIQFMVEDANAPKISRNTFTVNVEVSPRPIEFSAGPFALTQYVRFDDSFNATGGWGGYQYRIVDGALPAGVKLDSTGSLSGAAPSTGSYKVTIEVKDKEGLTARDEVTFTVKANPAITPAGSFDTTSGPVGGSISPDGTHLFVVSVGRLSVVDAATNTVVRQTALSVTPRGGQLSPDGTRYLVQSDAVVQIFDTESLAKVSEIKVSSIKDAVWSPDGTKIHLVRTKTAASVEMITYDVSTGTSLGAVTFGKTANYWKLTVLADGRVLASSVGTNQSFEVDPESGLAKVFHEGTTVTSLAIGPDNTVWTVNGSTVRRIDIATGEVIESHTLSKVQAYSMTVSPDGRWLYVSGNTELIVFDTQEGEELVRIPMASGSSSRVVISADGRTVFVTSGSGSTSVFKFTSAEN
ncbi:MULTISPECIES: putative Ig domain-containing protein [unclassified Microbacterium]|uniref:putative Ig domain-containing protein n=1 Tax=unclassified Microbacterium TaxID=2609290 RepID=UPI0028835485|nr:MULTISPECIES: putative Ig domain-containing protein [unclassified Microbacterium]